MSAEPTWAPDACTLPTAERPLRVAEFADLFRSVRSVASDASDTVSLHLDPSPRTAARAADLVVRETACCSFFTFALVAGGGTLRLDVTVPPAHREVLDALAAAAGSA